jgi:glycosyltransferase involved in cell wall biosynthesis
MATHTPLTVIIPCKDELPNIAACLDSVRGLADEILVADSGSTDGTLELIHARGDCRIIQRDYRNSADFKNWAIPQATHEWILLVDADERVTPELANEIRQLKESGALSRTGAVAYSIARTNFFLGHPVRYSGWQNDRVRRLFRRACQYETRRVHAELDVPADQTEYLRHSFTHHTFRSLKHFVAKLERYAIWGAEDLFEQGRRARVVDLSLRPLFRFLKHYVFQRGLLDGKAGLIISGLLAYSVLMKYAALWELERRAVLDAGTTGHSDSGKTVNVPARRAA